MLASHTRPSARNYAANVTDDPVDMCLFSDVDKSMGAGVLGYRYGPSNENCQLFMADRCAKNWDSVCDIAAKNRGATLPNNATIFGAAQGQRGTVLGGSTVGAQLVHSAGQRRFCKFSNTNIQQFPFDPTNMSSPMVTRINRSQYGNNPVCTVNPKTINSDVLMNKMLDDPGTSMETLSNICFNMRGKLGGTRLGRFCSTLKTPHN